MQVQGEAEYYNDIPSLLRPPMTMAEPQARKKKEKKVKQHWQWEFPTWSDGIISPIHLTEFLDFILCVMKNVS